MATRDVVLYGRPYRWVHGDPERALRPREWVLVPIPDTWEVDETVYPPRLVAIPNTSAETAEVVQPWTASPCAAWNQRQLALNLAARGIGEVLPLTERKTHA